MFEENNPMICLTLSVEKDDPQAEIHILDAGRFALDLKPKEIIRLTQEFMARQGLR